MTVIRAFDRPMSLDEAVEAVVKAALDGGAVIDAAREYGHLVDDRDIYELVVQGLADLAHARLAKTRRQDGAVDQSEIEARGGSVPAKAKPHAAKQFWASLQGNYEGADGKRKTLLQFTLPDWQHLREIGQEKAAGWLRVRDAADRAISAMQTHGAKTTAGLPDAEKRAISARLA